MQKLYTWRARWLPPGAVLVLMMAAFAGVRMTYSAPRFSDGNAYLYMGHAVAEGAALYRDIFYPSPPLIPYLAAWFGSCFGFTWWTFNLIPMVLTLVEAGAVFALLRRQVGDWVAVSACGIYLGSFIVLATTDFVTGIHLVTALVLLALWAVETKPPVVAGLLIGLALLAKIYAVVLLAALGAIYAWRRDFKSLMIYVASALAISGLTLLAWWWWLGDVLIENTISSHSGSIAGIDKVKILIFGLRHDWPLLLPAVAWFILAYRRKEYKVPIWIVLPLTSWLLMVIVYQDVYYLYLKITAAWLVLWWGWTLGRLRGSNWRPWMSGAAVALVVAVVAHGAGRYLTKQTDAAVIVGLDEMVDYVAEAVRPDELIYGDFEIASLVAVMAERDLWHHAAENNIKFFQTGFFRYAERLKQLAHDDVSLFVTKALIDSKGRVLKGPERVMPVTFFNRHCQPVKAFMTPNDYTHNAVVIWRCSHE